MLQLSQPPLPSYPNVTTPALVAGATSYTYPACAPGQFGTSNLAYTRGAGNVWSSTGAVACSLCTAGTWSNTSNAAACTGTPCAAGQVGPAGATTAAAATCTACTTAGTYSPAGSSACLACPAGTYSASTTGVGSCAGTVCAAGYYGPAGQTTAGAATCTLCPAGSYATATGSVSCTLCPAGTYAAGTGSTLASQCLACGANSYSFGGAAACSTCSGALSFMGSTLGCAPPPSMSSTNGLVFTLSGSAAEGVGAFGVTAGPAPSYTADLLSAANSALGFAGATYLSTPAYATSPLYYPVVGADTTSMTASAWINCPASGLTAPDATVFEWGLPSAASANKKFGISVSPAGGYAGLPGGGAIGPFAGACDGTLVPPTPRGELSIRPPARPPARPNSPLPPLHAPSLPACAGGTTSP